VPGYYRAVPPGQKPKLSHCALSGHGNNLPAGARTANIATLSKGAKKATPTGRFDIMRFFRTRFLAAASYPTRPLKKTATRRQPGTLSGISGQKSFLA